MSDSGTVVLYLLSDCAYAGYWAEQTVSDTRDGCWYVFGGAAGH